MSTSLRKRVFCLYPNAEVQKPIEHDEDTWYINVKSLHDIRDKDAFYITNLLSGWKLTDQDFDEAIMYKVNITEIFWNIKAEITENIISPTVHIEIGDYLRSHSYAMPAYGFSVDQLIERGIFVLDLVEVISE